MPLASLGASRPPQPVGTALSADSRTVAEDHPVQEPGYLLRRFLRFLGPADPPHASHDPSCLCSVLPPEAPPPEPGSPPALARAFRRPPAVQEREPPGRGPRVGHGCGSETLRLFVAPRVFQTLREKADTQNSHGLFLVEQTGAGRGPGARLTPLPRVQYKQGEPEGRAGRPARDPGKEESDDEVRGAGDGDSGGGARPVGGSRLSERDTPAGPLEAKDLRGTPSWNSRPWAGTPTGRTWHIPF